MREIVQRNDRREEKSGKKLRERRGKRALDQSVKMKKELGKEVLKTKRIQKVGKRILLTKRKL